MKLSADDAAKVEQLWPGISESLIGAAIDALEDNETFDERFGARYRELSYSQELDCMALKLIGERFEVHVALPAGVLH